MDEQTVELKKYFDDSKSAIAITGAGISFSACGLSLGTEKSERRSGPQEP